VENPADLEEVSTEQWASAPHACIKRCFRGTIRCRFRLENFPFDSQLVLITISAFTNASLKYKIWPGYTHYYHPRVAHHPEFQIVKSGAKIESHKVGTGNCLFPHFVYALKIERKSGFFLSKVAFVFGMCLFCAWASFFLGPDDIGDRLNLLLTLFLTSVAFQFVINERLPSIPYLTKMDRFVNVCYALLLVEVLESVIVFQLSEANYDSTILWKIDMSVFAFVGACTIGLLLWFHILKILHETHHVTPTVDCPCSDCRYPEPDNYDFGENSTVS